MNATAILTTDEVDTSTMEMAGLTLRTWPTPPLQPGEEDITEEAVFEFPEYGAWMMPSAVSDRPFGQVRVETMARLEEESAAVQMGSQQLRRPRLHSTYLPSASSLPSARSLLTDRVQATLNRLFPMMERVIRLERVPVQKLELFGFRDPEEDWRELVVSLSVNLPESEALLLWDKLGHAIEGMMEYLPSYMVNILYDRISIEVLDSVGEIV